MVQTDDANTKLQKWIKSDKVETVTNTYGNQFNLYSFDKDSIFPNNEKKRLFYSR